MRILNVAIAIAAACVFSGGCLSPKTSGLLVEKGRLTIGNASFGLGIDISQDASRLTDDGFLHVQVELKNNDERDYSFQYRFVWMDKDGLEMKHALSPWRQVVLHGRELATIEAVSTVKGAADFRLYMRQNDR